MADFLSMALPERDLPFEVHLRAEDNALYRDVQKLIDAKAEGLSIRECAEKLGVSKTTLHHLTKRLEAK